jgi:hypothetical protein
MFGFSSNPITDSVINKAISTFLQNNDELVKIVDSLDPEAIKTITVTVINRLEQGHLKEISDLIQTKLSSASGGTRRIRRYGTRSKK